MERTSQHMAASVLRATIQKGLRSRIFSGYALSRVVFGKQRMCENGLRNWP